MYAHRMNLSELSLNPTERTSFWWNESSKCYLSSKYYAMRNLTKNLFGNFSQRNSILERQSITWGSNKVVVTFSASKIILRLQYLRKAVFKANEAVSLTCSYAWKRKREKNIITQTSNALLDIINRIYLCYWFPTFQRNDMKFYGIDKLIERKNVKKICFPSYLYIWHYEKCAQGFVLLVNIPDLVLHSNELSIVIQSMENRKAQTICNVFDTLLM